MAVGDLLCKDGVACNFVPVDLCKAVSLRDDMESEAWLLTSFRFFCSRIASRNRAVGLSLLVAMLAEHVDER